MITIHWHSYKWRPTVPPDQAEYSHLKTLDERLMKTHLKTLLGKVRADLTKTSPYSYRKAIFMLTLAVGLITLAMGFKPDTGSPSLLHMGLKYAGWGLLIVAVIHGASNSMTQDSIRKNLIVAREYYVMCWVVAQKLEYASFHQYVTKLIDKGPPDYDVR